ncbi:Phosphatidylinositol transfer protein alpha isoform [Astathelohania contejeani]|uniref:Phosphatidylinositol transfer protein alpha isoform n=1 Tax=Astathelohania contejeani TaxID=164912 RepID=A0ABQ7I2A7_9MICR|nr:Phosphatidylinositol transfer protein alpha isoform [Thelohania contejeani]
MTILKKEYRIVLPLTISEYNIGQLYTVAQMSKSESTGDTSIIILENKDDVHPVLGKCRKTVKIMNLGSKVPAIIRKCVSDKALSLTEEAYNAFPRCNTHYVNNYFSSEKFSVSVESVHEEGAALRNDVFGDAEAIVDFIDIGGPAVDKRYDPSKHQNSRGPLGPEWIRRCQEKGIPLMTCYKKVTIQVNCFGLGWVTKEVDKQMRNIFLISHQQLFCSMDDWINLSLQDIRDIEEQTKKELESKVSK